jgi:hypothetical protein
MSITSPLSTSEAQQIAEEIARGYGWFSRSARGKTPQEVLDAVGILKSGLGASVKTCAFPESLM